MRRLFLSFALALLGICEVNALASLKTPPKKASYDLRFETFARSLPVGAYARGEIGYGVPLWQHQGPLYGFIRPYLRFQTSALVNSLQGGLEFYPISFLGLYAGKSFMIRSLKELDQVNCKQGNITCETNNLQRNIFGAKLALKFGNFYAMTRAQWHQNTIKDNQQELFFDEQGTLLGLGSRDTLFQGVQILGYDITRSHGLGGLYKRNFMQKSRQDSSMSVLFYKHSFSSFFSETKNPITLLVGPGVFHTRQDTDHLMLFALMQFSYEKGLTLF